MTTVDLPLVTDPRLDVIDWTTETRVHTGVLRKMARRILAIREIGILTILALIGYIAVGAWMFYGQHFFINDELNKIADAVYVTVGRDPHLGAIGFYWPPLPQLLNCIFVPIVEPFGATIMAGPIETAFCMALTIPVLAKIGKSLGVNRWTTFVICLVFAITPVAIYNSSNGMSESCFFLTGSLTLLGFLRYIKSHSTGDMILFSFGMSAFILTRLEGPFEVVVLVVVASFEWRALRSWVVLRQNLWTAILLGLPPLVCFGFWLLVQWVLLKDPLFFLHQSGGVVAPAQAVGAGTVAHTAGGGAIRPWLPNPAEGPLRVFPWAGHWVLVLGLTLAVALLCVILRPRSDRTRGSIGILSAAGVILAIQMYTVDYGGFGDPRYFSMMVPFGFVAALWLAARPRRTPLNPSPPRSPLGSAWNIGLIAILVVNAGTGSWTMSSGTTTAIEHECTFFQGGVARILPFLGRGGNPKSKAYCRPYGDAIGAFQEVGSWLDHRLKPTNRVLTDNETIFAADLFTHHPNQYIVRNDRDWEKIVANPGTHVTYIITESSTRLGTPESGSADAVAAGLGSDYGATIINERPQAWKLVHSVSGTQKDPNAIGTWVQVYQLSGKISPAGINGPNGLGGG